MKRHRLTDAERVQRRKERARFSFSDAAYQHYDLKRDGFGKPEDWERIAEELFGKFDRLHEQTTRTTPGGRFAKFLEVLGLSALPPAMDALTQAFRRAMFKAHPDYGGSDVAAREVLEAYAVLKKEIK